jgi:hypothetical protein
LGHDFGVTIPQVLSAEAQSVEVVSARVFVGASSNQLLQVGNIIGINLLRVGKYHGNLKRNSDL